MAQIEIYADKEHLANAAATHFVDTATSAVKQRGRFSVALSGGSTPKSAYTLLASETFAGKLSWGRLHIFWGDERCVPPDHPHSNYRMVAQSMLDHKPIPAGNVHRMQGEIEPRQAASLYEAELRAFFSPQSPSSNQPSFDLVLLGLGEDGHTASLFPGSSALQVTDRWVVAVDHEVGPPPLVSRITLTLPVINASRQVIFLVGGASKASRLKQVLNEPGSDAPLPAQFVNPLSGRLLWLVDEEAAGDI